MRRRGQDPTGGNKSLLDEFIRQERKSADRLAHARNPLSRACCRYMHKHTAAGIEHLGETELTPLERAVIDALLSRQEPGYDELRIQFQTCRAATREMTGVGFYTSLRVDPAAPPAPADVGNPLGAGREFPDDVYAEIDGLEHGAGFLLWLEAGRLETLEGFTYCERWPSEVLGFDVRLAPLSR